MTVDQQAVEMERALLGCTTHPSGVLQTWYRCYQDKANLPEVGRAMLLRSQRRLDSAHHYGSQKDVEREIMLQPLIRRLFAPTH